MNDITVDALFAAIENMDQQASKLNDAILPVFDNERYLSDEELAARLKVSRRTLQNWRLTGTIGYVTFVGKVLYRESDVMAIFRDNYSSRCYNN